MTANRRIVLNIVATYGRSLFALCCGLFSGRWALMALGEVDYGLFGVVGGLTVFIAFFNNVLAFSIARFYATAIGASNKAQAAGVGYETSLEECRKWFSIAVVIHTAIPVLLMVIGYPIGNWSVRCFLTIPAGRIDACVWVFRFVCFSCFIGMVSVPFSAMYTAKQYIAELTIYSFVTTALNVCMLYYMVSHPGVWLTKFAFWTCLLFVAPQVVIGCRAIALFPECRFRWRYARVWHDMGSLFAYTGWQMFGALGGLFRSQALQILVNKYYGPSVNAAMSVANTVNGHTQSLSSAMTGAFQPAISTAFGAGDMNRMRSLSYKACKFGLLLALVFVLPLVVELPEVMKLWLKNPPQYVVEFCWCMMAVMMIDRASIGHMLAVNACGKIAAYQVVLGLALMAAFPISWAFASSHCGPVLSMGVGLVSTMLVCSLGRVWFARKLVGLSARYWVVRMMLPVLLTSAIGCAAGFATRIVLPESFLRVVVTTVVLEAVFLPLVWVLLLDAEERVYVTSKIRGRFRHG